MVNVNPDSGQEVRGRDQGQEMPIYIDPRRNDVGGRWAVTHKQRKSKKGCLIWNVKSRVLNSNVGNKFGKITRWAYLGIAS